MMSDNDLVKMIGHEVSSFKNDHQVTISLHMHLGDLRKT